MVTKILFQIIVLQQLLFGINVASNDLEKLDIAGFDTLGMKDRCTSIGLGPKATVDGSTITTHNNDCQECDLRLTHVPAYDWPPGSRRPLYDIRDAYPRYVEADIVFDANNKFGNELNIHGPDYASSKVDRTIYNWNLSVPMGYIDQVPHTYAYTLGTYAIQNEKQVSIGESTCSAKFIAVPVNGVGKNGQWGNASLHMETLTEIALERCATARCAIQTMGDLATKHGFYGPEWDGDKVSAEDEAGEALTVSDAFETWMFHILPDDSGSSAIWVAQRVPDDHITAVANQFVIGEIDVADSANFLASANIFEVAIRHGFFSPDPANTANPNARFHFSNAYGNNRHATAFACTRRIWRVFTMAAPSLLPMFSPYTDGMASFGFGPDGLQPYPFSVKVDQPLAVSDVMRIARDQYEGSPFDMTVGLDSGPYGDPMRFPPMTKWRDPVNGVSWAAYTSGLDFQRPISLWRTAYSSITQARSSLPDVIGAVTWLAPYAPHHSSYLPIYASASQTPSSLKAGTQYKLDKASNWWIHCLTSNYASRWYRYTIVDIMAFQKQLETDLFASARGAEDAALAALAAPGSEDLNRNHVHVRADASTVQRSQVGSQVESLLVTHRNSALRSNAASNASPTGSGSISARRLELSPQWLAAAALLQDFHESAASTACEQWWDFFFSLAGTFRDMYKVVDPHTENFNQAFRYLTVPRGWFESIGFWGAPGTAAPDEVTGAVPVSPINVPTLESLAAYHQHYPAGPGQPYPTLASMLAKATSAALASVTPPPGPAPVTPSPAPTAHWNGGDHHNSNDQDHDDVGEDHSGDHPGDSSHHGDSNGDNSGDGSSDSSKFYYSSNTLYMSTVTAAVFGAAVGACITLLLLRGGLSRHDTYLPIR